MPKTKQPPIIYQIKISLNQIKPEIWRRFQVRGDISLVKLHKVIQKVMGWGNCHPYAFDVGSSKYTNPVSIEEDGHDLGYQDASKVKLANALPNAGDTCRYRYDFGDNWEHTIEIEKTFASEPGERYPLCIEGARICPPEDCGGVSGYEKIVRTLAAPENFDPEIVNARLSRRSISKNYAVWTSHLSRTIEPDFDFDFDYPFRSMSSLLSRFCNSDRHLQSYLLRKGMLGQPPFTFQKAANTMGYSHHALWYTVKIVDGLCLKNNHAFRTIAQKAFCIVTNSGGIVCVSELLQSLFADGSDGDKLKYAEPFVELLSKLPCWSDAGLQPVHDGMIAWLNPSEILDRLASAIAQVASSNADETIAPDLWSIDVGLLKTKLLPLLEQPAGQYRIETISDALFAAAVSRMSEPPAMINNRIYSPNLYTIRFDRLMVALETILKRSVVPMHLTEIFGTVIEFQKADTAVNERAVAGSLSRSKEIMLWDRGTFVHRDNVRMPYDLLHEIEDIVEQELNQDIPFLSISRLFDTFRAQCLAVSIASETALYMCLRALGNPRLEYPNYPYVLLKGNKRLPIPVVLEQYLIDAGKPVTRPRFKKYIRNKLGINLNLLNIYALRIPNILRLDDDELLHVNHLHLSQESVDTLISSVIDILLRKKNVSAEELFNDKEIGCLTIGITTPEILHALLLLKAADKITGQYPQLTLAGDAKAGSADK